MSVRAVESRFNLRTMVAEETAARPLVLTQTPVTGLFSQPTASPVSSKQGLKFDFSKLHGASQPAQAKAPPKLDLAPTQFAAPLKNPFEASKESNKADVMRLTAVVDDLQSRLKKSTDRAVMAETQLQKTHAAMIAERNNAAERIKAATAQLGAAHATESQLRSELSKAAKAPVAPNQPKTPSFDSAVSAVMAAEGAAEKTKKEMDALKSRILAQDVESKQMASQIIELQADSARANERSIELHKQFSAATHELSAAREAERSAIEERDKLTIELEKAKDALQKAIEAQAVEAKASEAAPPAAPTEAAEDETEVSKAKVGGEADCACPPQMEMACCPKCGSDVSVASNPVASVEDHLHIENAPSTEAPVPIAVAMDPIKTHARYSRLREKVMSLTASIARLQRSNQDDELLPVMIEKRNDLYKRAKALKAQYDTVFGAMEPDSVVKLSGMESFVTPRAADTIDVREAEEAYYAPIGDAPDPCMTYTISFAREMARNCPVGGAFDFGSLDCGIGIGKAMMKPITLNRVVIGDDAAKDSEPTEGHDAHNDMVTAVVSDLTRYLKYVKAKGEEEYTQSTQEAMARSYA
jgi:regulator of replication initiation timing